MIKVFITGVAGQLGSQLAEDCLKKGWLVVGFDNLSTGSTDNLNLFTIKHSDFTLVTNHNNIPFLKYDYVFHCAALANIVDSIKEPFNYYINNVSLTMNFLEFFRAIGCKKFIYCASSSCYGDSPPLPTDENAPIDCKYPYALSKYMGEELVLHYGEIYNMPVISFRIFNIYSPYIKSGKGYGSVIKTFARSYLEIFKDKKPLIMIGSGMQNRDFLHVKDCSRALIMGAESDIKNEVFNLGANEPHSINYLIKLMFGDDYPRTSMEPRPGEPNTTWADTEKIQEALGWKPEISFEQGIAEVIENIENYRGFPYFDEVGYKKVHEEWNKYIK